MRHGRRIAVLATVRKSLVQVGGVPCGLAASDFVTECAVPHPLIAMNSFMVAGRSGCDTLLGGLVSHPSLIECRLRSRI